MGFSSLRRNKGGNLRHLEHLDFNARRADALEDARPYRRTAVHALIGLIMGMGWIACVLVGGAPAAGGSGGPR